MGNVTMLTVVPIQLAQQLAEKKRVKDFNNFPQINMDVLQAIRTYMTEHVGYDDLPMACLSQSKVDLSAENVGESIGTYLPVNSKESVLFQLEMPEDMIVSVKFSDLLEASNEANDAVGKEDLELTLDMLTDNLSLGVLPDETEEQIFFIPFLDSERCKFYASFNKNFDTNELKLPGIEQVNLRQLQSFVKY